MKSFLSTYKQALLIIIFSTTFLTELYSQQKEVNNKNLKLLNRKNFSFNYNIGLHRVYLIDYYDNYRINTIANHIKNNRDGLSFHTEIQSFYKQRVGLSLSYEYFGNKGESAIVDIGLPNLPVYADYTHSTYIHSFSPSLLFKSPFFYNSDLILKTGIDYNFYKNPVVVDTEEFEVNAKNTGFNIGLSNVFKLNENLRLGLNFTYRLGIINTIEITNSTSKQSLDLSGNDKININRICLGLSLGIQ